jgi:hypothetical protein
MDISADGIGMIAGLLATDAKIAAASEHCFTHRNAPSEDRHRRNLRQRIL